jgi:hypothetical protein
MEDTSPEAFEVWIEMQRRIPPDQRLRNALDWSGILEGMAQENVRRLYPQASEREVFLRAAARRLGWATIKKVYGWEPPDEA